MSDWYTEQKIREAKVREELVATASLHPEIVQARAFYNGSSDSGYIEEVYLVTQEDLDTNTLAGPREELGEKDRDGCHSLQELIRDYVYHLLPSGWEINEGSEGVVVIDMKTLHGRIYHTEFVISEREEDIEF